MTEPAAPSVLPEYTDDALRASIANQRLAPVVQTTLRALLTVPPEKRAGIVGRAWRATRRTVYDGPGYTLVDAPGDTHWAEIIRLCAAEASR